MNLCTYLNNTVFIKVLEHIFADIRNISCDFFGAKLCISCLCIVFLNMNRCINIISYDFFVKENRILVVITFPGHKADKCVLTDSNFTVVCSRTVSENFAFLNSLSSFNNRTLVDTCTLVRTKELDNLKVLNSARIVLYTNVAGVNA